MRHKVDPAALLVAVFAVGAGPLLQSGLWTYVNTVTALVVLVVVLYFSWPAEEVRTQGSLGWTGNVAFATVYAFIIGIAAGWPMQRMLSRFWRLPNCGDARDAQSELEYFHVSDCFRDNDDTIAALGTAGGMVVGAVALVVLFFVLSGLSGRPASSDSDKMPDPTADGPSHGASPTTENTNTRIPSKAEE